MPNQRLQKLLSTLGYGSRRDCEKLIADGLVTLNGEIAQLGDKADITVDVIEVNKSRIFPASKEYTYIALNKPVKVISNIKKKDNRKTVLDFVNHKGYLFIVGRLDYLSEGLILLTNDGELANHLTHPRFEHEKEYDVLVQGNPSISQLKMWQMGGKLAENYHTMPCDVRVIRKVNDSTWLNVILKEGKKRQIREVGRIIGLPVKRIIRTRISTLKLGNLQSGKWRYLNNDEIINLKIAAQLYEQQ